MQKEVKFVVVGNCQARPMSSLIGLMSKAFTCELNPIVVHLARDSDFETNMATFHEADYIFAQFVQDSFPCAHVTSSFLRSHFVNKVLVWPNIFYAGQSPGLCYLTSIDQTRIGGPLHEYHFLPIFDAWRGGLTVEKCESLVNSDRYLDRALVTSNQSIEELKLRERMSDIVVSDVISDNSHLERYFFTFNHPTTKLMHKVCERLLQSAGIRINIRVTADIYGEDLNKIIPPIPQEYASVLGLRFPTTDLSRGVEFMISESRARYGRPKVYTFRELIEASYYAFDQQRELVESCRTTPKY